MSSSHLFVLPDDLLGQCFDPLAAHDLLRLWSTGDFQLHQRLKQKQVVKHWRVVAHRDKPLSSTSFKDWFGTKFPHVVSIAVTGDPNSYGGVVFSDLRNLPSRLTQLTFAKPPEHDQLLKICDLPATLQSLTLDRYFVDITDMNLPNLTHVNMECRFSGAEGSTLIFTDALTVLRLGDIQMCNTMKLPLANAPLPPNLTQLTFTGPIPDAVIDFPLPQTLKSFHFWNVITSTLPVALQSLPELTNLHVINYHHTWVDNKLIVASLPRTLTQLNTDYGILFEENAIVNLPRRLQSLYVFDSLSSEAIMNDVSALPRSLKRLHLLNYTYKALTVEHVKALPPSLESLVTHGVVKDRTSEVFDAMPKSLAYLGFSVPAVSPDPNELTSECLQKLPPNLKTLLINGPLPDTCLMGLPKLLTTLRVSVHGLLSSSSQLLPITLTSLNFTLKPSRVATEQSMTLHMSMFPRGLLALEICAEFIEKTLEGLPPGLTRLEINCTTILSDNSLELLPKSLTRLSLPFNNVVTNDGIRKLPVGLMTLNLRNPKTITHDIADALPYRGDYPVELATKVRKRFSENQKRDLSSSSAIVPFHPEHPSQLDVLIRQNCRNLQEICPL
jgi:hypothetical protein